MTQDEITVLAGHRIVSPWVMKLAMDVAKAEREACAKVCEDRYSDHKDLSIASGEAGMCAYHIRARGEA